MTKKTQSKIQQTYLKPKISVPVFLGLFETILEMKLLLQILIFRNKSQVLKILKPFSLELIKFKHLTFYCFDITFSHKKSGFSVENIKQRNYFRYLSIYQSLQF